MNLPVITNVDNQGVVTMTLNRPDKHNAFDHGMIEALTTALKETSTNPKARVMILAASGNTFSSGADLAWMRHMGTSNYEQNLRDAETLSDMLNMLNNLPIPTIARIQGPAFGGALGMICCCDLAIATVSASFAFSEVKMGLIPATITPYITQAIGIRQTRRYFLTGEKIDADQALYLGLIHELVSDSELDSALSKTVSTLLKNSPAAISAAKKLIRDIGQQPMGDDTRQKTCQRLADIRLSKEGQEGLSAFLEKRKPSWQ